MMRAHGNAGRTRIKSHSHAHALTHMRSHVCEIKTFDDTNHIVTLRPGRQTELPIRLQPSRLRMTDDK